MGATEEEIARIDDVERAFATASLAGWKPHEAQQQTAIALLDLASAPAREALLSALFGVPARCPCGHTSRVQRVRTGWDLQLWCSAEDCEWFDTAILNVELKPWGAPVHYSRANRTTWMEREKQGFLKLNDSTPLPEHGCVGGGCASHPHSSYRGYPTLPQVIAWPDDGVPRLILTDYSGDLNQIYGTSGWGYAIAGVEVRRIPDALTSIPESLAGITLSELDARLVSLAVTGLWMRTAPKDFAELTANAGLRALVPPAIRDRADAWGLDHQE